MRNELIALIKETVTKLWPLVRQDVKKVAMDIGKELGKEAGKKSLDWLIDEMVRGLRDLLEPMPPPPTNVLVHKPVQGPLTVPHQGPLPLRHRLVFDPLALGRAAKNILLSKELFAGGMKVAGKVVSPATVKNLTSIVSKKTSSAPYISLENPTSSSTTNILRSKELFGGSKVPSIAEAAKAALGIVDKVPGETAADVLIAPALSIADKVPGIAEATKVALTIANKVPGDMAGDALIAPALAIADKVPGDTAGDALITVDSQVMTYVLGASAVVLIGAVLYHLWWGSSSSSSDED